MWLSLKSLKNKKRQKFSDKMNKLFDNYNKILTSSEIQRKTFYRKINIKLVI